MTKSIFNISKVLLLLLVFGIFSCNKGGEESKEAKEALLTAHKWEMVKAKLSESDTASAPKTKNTIYEFAVDGDMNNYSKRGELISTQKWALNGEVFTFGSAGDSKIVKLDEESLTIEGQMSSGAKAIAYFSKYKK